MENHYKLTRTFSEVIDQIDEETYQWQLHAEKNLKKYNELSRIREYNKHHRSDNGYSDDEFVISEDYYDDIKA